MANLITWYGPQTGTRWDETRIFRSSSETGTFSQIAVTTPISVTSFWDTSGSSTDWYKIAFYDTQAAIYSAYSSAFQASASDSERYTNPTELRRFMQFSVEDFPTDEDINFLLDQVHTQLGQDIAGTTTISGSAKLKLLALFLGASYVMRSLASKSLSKGYVAVSLEGGNIQKAYAAMMQQADYWFGKYQEQLAKDTVDVAFTKFWDDVLDQDTTQDLKDLMNGVSDGMDFQNGTLYSVTDRRGSGR